MKHCPLPDETGKRGPCTQHACEWYIHLLGKHPQKDAPVEEWGCTFRFIPILLIENAQQTRQHAAAVESSRNAAREDASSIGASVFAMAEEVRMLARSARPVPATLEVYEARPRLGFFRRLLGKAS